MRGKKMTIGFFLYQSELDKKVEFGKIGVCAEWPCAYSFFFFFIVLILKYRIEEVQKFRNMRRHWFPYTVYASPWTQDDVYGGRTRFKTEYKSLALFRTPRFIHLVTFYKIQIFCFLIQVTIQLLPLCRCIKNTSWIRSEDA